MIGRGPRIAVVHCATISDRPMRAYILLPALMLACAGCGYRGPLYLPQSKPQVKTPAPAPVGPPPERPTPSEAAPAPK